MRLVFINQAHPDNGHVSGMRLGFFAKAMARRGHQVVLLTCALPDSTQFDGAETHLADRLRKHDWATPLIIAVKPLRRRTLELIRENHLPNAGRRTLTLWQFLVHGGVSADWQVPAERTATRLAKEFKPDLVWATFGNTSTLVLAKSLARHAGCPWLMDIKDNWKTYVPKGLRHLMAWRFWSAAGWTSNAVRHQEIAAHWLKLPRYQIIYSGVADVFFRRQPQPDGQPARSDLLLVGSTRARTGLDVYLAAVAQWLSGLADAERAQVRFVYAGSDVDRVRASLQTSPLPCKTELLAQLSLADLAQLAQRAFANSYLVGQSGFHHKLLELLACGQPLVCYPSESPESLRLAAQIETNFASCQSVAELRDALADAWARRDAVHPTSAPPPWRWDDFAEELERFFRSVLRDEVR